MSTAVDLSGLSDEQLKLVREFVRALRRSNASSQLKTPADKGIGLQGMGKEVWRKADTQEYINEERQSRDLAVHPEPE